MTGHARALVIGGGIMGVSALYHLAANGWTDAVLCEKAELTSGSTWHAAGQIAHAAGSRTMAWMNDHSIRLYRRLEEETGQAVGWHGCGGLRVAYHDAEVDWLLSLTGVGRLLDLPMEMVGPAGVAEAHPFYDVSGIKAALRTFDDGHVDPSGATQAMAAAARALGARIERRNRVTGVTRRRAGGWTVHTERGDRVAEHVVIAAGGHANRVGRWFDLTVPSLSVLHHYFVTDTVPELEERGTELPVVRDNTFGGYLRQEQRSGLIGVYESENCEPVWVHGAPWESENELFEADYDRVGHLLQRALDRMPVLAGVGIRRVVRGAITHTPDGGPLIGRAPGHRDVWMACGASIGIAWAGGAGRLLADLMVHGEAELDTRGMDPRRFGPHVDERYVEVKTREDFEIRHDTPAPGMQRPAGRPWRKSPVHDRLAARGAVFGEVHGWERPRWFAPPGTPPVDANGWRRQPWFAAAATEHRAVRERAGVIDLTAFSQFSVSGAGAAALLERLCANPPPRRDGRVALAHLLTPRGNIETEMTVTRLAPDRFFLGSSAVSQIRDRDWLACHLEAGEDVRVEDLSSDWGFLALAGPRSREILQAGSTGDPSNTTLPWMAARETTLFGLDCLLLRVGYTGELGYEIHAPCERLGALYDALMNAGAGHGIADFGAHALNSLRMEKAYRGGAELSAEVGLPEADMMRFFRPDNRRFVGREATLDRVERGPRWRVACLAVEADDADCGGGEPVLAGERAVGLVTSGAFGHTVGTSLAFAYLEPGLAVPDTRLGVQILGEPRPARVLREPAYDPGNARVRG